MSKERIYVDTSVFGGVFDSEFDKASEIFLNQIRYKEFVLITFAIVQEEILLAPDRVQDLFNEFLLIAEIIKVNRDALLLREQYINANIVSPKYSNDALHVALATVAKCKIITSWNFKHIVYFKKIPLYNAVNILQGYEPIAIHSPLEVIKYED